MEILLHINSKKLQKDFTAALDEYKKRTSPFSKVNVIFHKNITDFTPKNGSYVINVNANGELVSSPALAELINNICVDGYSTIEFILSDDFSYNQADKQLAVSYLKMSSDLTAVCLMEQIYRAYTIQNNITYHK